VLQRLAKWLGAGDARSDRGRKPRVALAVAVLLVELMRSDRELAPGERAMVLRVLGQSFPQENPQALLDEAHSVSHQATDYFAFTSVLNEQMDQPQKIALVERLWQVAYEDGQARAEEMHTIDRIAGLLHVTHGEYIAAKLHAKQAAGMSPG